MECLRYCLIFESLWMGENALFRMQPCFVFSISELVVTFLYWQLLTNAGQSWSSSWSISC